MSRSFEIPHKFITYQILEIRNNLLGENIFLNLKASCIKKYQKDLGGSGNVHSCAFNQDMDIQAT